MGVLLTNKGNGRYRIMIAFSISVTTNISYKEKSYQSYNYWEARTILFISSSAAIIIKILKVFNNKYKKSSNNKLLENRK